MNVTTLKLAKIKPAEYNPRTISDEELEGLKHSLLTFGQVENLIVNKDGTLISGHQRYKAMEALGWEEATVVQLDIDKQTEKKLNLEMNNQAISGSWDMLKLGQMLDELKSDEDYEALRLNKLEPVDLGGVNYTTLEEGKAPTNDTPQASLGGGVKSYTLVFDSEEEQEEFMDWVMSLRALYPDAETISQRILFAIKKL